MGRVRKSMAALHPDVVRALSVVIDVDDVGEDGLRRQKIEEVLLHLKKQDASSFFVYRFSVMERGWSIMFAFSVEPGGCFLRLMDRHDYESESQMSRSDRKAFRERISRMRDKDLEVSMPDIAKVTADDLLAGVQSFLVADVMGA